MSESTLVDLLSPNDLNHTFTIYVLIVKGNKDSSKFNRLQCLNILLKSFQAADVETKIVLPGTDRNQKLNFK